MEGEEVFCVVLAAVLAVGGGVAWWNRRCPACRATMTVHQRPGGMLYLLGGFLVDPRLECPACGVKTPLRWPMDFRGWWFFATMFALSGGLRYLWHCLRQ